MAFDDTRFPATERTSDDPPEGTSRAQAAPPRLPKAPLPDRPCRPEARPYE